MLPVNRNWSCMYVYIIPSYNEKRKWNVEQYEQSCYAVEVMYVSMMDPDVCNDPKKILNN